MIQIGHEVENPEGTVSGIVYHISDGLYNFIDEHHGHYRMKEVRRCNYMSYHEVMDLMEKYPNLFSKKTRETLFKLY